jgi:hypothetical protein
VYLLNVGKHWQGNLESNKTLYDESFKWIQTSNVMVSSDMFQMHNKVKETEESTESEDTERESTDEDSENDWEESYDTTSAALNDCDEICTYASVLTDTNIITYNCHGYLSLETCPGIALLRKIHMPCRRNQ